MKASSLLLLLVAFVAAALAQDPPADCSVVLCPANTECKSVSLECEDSLCPQVACVAIETIEDPCASADCLQGTMCLPEPKQCFTTPCPQFRCLPMNEFVCATSVCASTTRCVASPKQCFTTPCPQYDCVPLEDEEEPSSPTDDADQCSATSCTASQVCISEPKQCFTTPCPQFACIEMEECPQMCSEEYKPVCGSNQLTYPNLCKLRAAMCLLKASIYVQHDGECTVEEECTTVCPMNYSPVCGSDGVTYSNPCALSVASCKSKSAITEVFSGECGDCNIACTLEYAPVCGTDGFTYSNACALRVAACKAKSSVLAVKHTGECLDSETECPQFCTMEYAPKCGSNGITYGNECKLREAACSLKTSLTVAHDGECTAEDSPCNSICTEEYNPLCGSDFKTYSNKCNFESAKCLAKSASFVLHAGQCKKTLWESVATMDADADDVVTYDEFIAAQPEMTADEQKSAFTSIDKNSDGVLTPADYSAGTSSTSSGTKRATVIVGVIAAFVGGIALVIAGSLYFKHQKKQRKQEEQARNLSSKSFTKEYEAFEDTL